MASGERYVDKLQEELGKRAPMFVDDANFIRCARCAACTPLDKPSSAASEGVVRAEAEAGSRSF